MKARILGVHEAPPSNGQWKSLAIIDVELDIHGVPLILRGLTVKSKELKTFVGFRSFKRGEEWAQTIDFPDHYKAVADALLEAWLEHKRNPDAVLIAPNHAEFTAEIAPSSVPSNPTRAPKVNYDMLADCPF